LWDCFLSASFFRFGTFISLREMMVLQIRSPSRSSPLNRIRRHLIARLRSPPVTASQQELIAPVPPLWLPQGRWTIKMERHPPAVRMLRPRKLTIGNISPGACSLELTGTQKFDLMLLSDFPLRAAESHRRTGNWVMSTPMRASSRRRAWPLGLRLK
jgi:hypothetical protein